MSLEPLPVSEFQQNCVDFPNLHATLDSLKGKGIKLGLITNGYGEFQYSNIRGLGIEPYFDLNVISEWEGKDGEITDLLEIIHDLKS
ncbi:HAD hydrolase-like protein [Paenibacillus sp. ISL-20]|uniref:HAD family hydrolase n=1 Tax=Paenibacillus sp. ISL-20 TaxID=2819163 RepID=UPI001BE9723F|nr:HAD hydrolase-like protein [Paenibacillus sp. ISL-20]